MGTEPCRGTAGADELDEPYRLDASEPEPGRRRRRGRGRHRRGPGRRRRRKGIQAQECRSRKPAVAPGTVRCECGPLATRCVRSAGDRSRVRHDAPQTVFTDPAVERRSRSTQRTARSQHRHVAEAALAPCRWNRPRRYRQRPHRTSAMSPVTGIARLASPSRSHRLRRRPSTTRRARAGPPPPPSSHPPGAFGQVPGTPPSVAEGRSASRPVARSGSSNGHGTSNQITDPHPPRLSATLRTRIARWRRGDSTVPEVKIAAEARTEFGKALRAAAAARARCQPCSTVTGPTPAT